MKDELIRDKIRQAVEHHASDVHPNPFLAQRVIAQAKGKEKTIMKKRLSISILLIAVLLLMAAAGLAIALLSPKEVVEQVAIPLAVGNDGRVGINNSYSPDELSELVRTLNENGITLEENNAIMQCLKNGQGYYEEETIMEICRQAFGGNYYTWTLEEQDWFEGLMVQCGWHETPAVRMPGKDNMTYEAAEAFAFKRLKQAYGTELDPENREVYTLSRAFYLDSENGGKAAWSFMLEPLDVTHGRYDIRFSDDDPEGTAFVSADIPDWTQPYTGSQLISQFHSAYSWAQGKWAPPVWQQLHEMMQHAQIEPDNYYYTVCKGYLLTAYPEPTEGEITRDDAIRIGKEALQLDRAALDSAVLTEYEGKRTWLVGMIINQPDGQAPDEEAGTYVISIDSTTGKVESVRKSTLDDDISVAFVPQAAYEKAWEGILKNSDYVRIAKDVLQKAYPELNMEVYTVNDRSGKNHNMYFTSKDIRQGDASVVITSDGTVLNVAADPQPLNGNNLFDRFSSAYGYFGYWSQEIWTRLGQEMETLEPMTYENLPLKYTRYPQEASVSIDHEKAQELAFKASGKRVVEANTCVLVSADPHPVWIIRLITDEPDNPVFGIDAETGEVVFTEQFKTDYTPRYVLYSLPETWRKIELENLGAPYMAKVAITHKFGDMWLDEPELDVDDTENWECVQNGATVRYIGRWAGMKSYEVELDKNGFVLRCELTETTSTKVKPDMLPDTVGEPIPIPTPLPDGKPWFFGMDFADKAFWDEMERKLTDYGVRTENYYSMKRKEWAQQYGDFCEWPVDCQVLDHFMSQTDAVMLQDVYPMFPQDGKKTREEIYALAREAFHQEADGIMGAEWVDQLRCNGMLWNKNHTTSGDVINEPSWFINMEVFDPLYRDWSAKGYVILSEDGTVLYCTLELMSNG